MAEPLLRRPEFWASHYFLILCDEEHDSLEMVEQIFGVPPDAVDRFYSQYLVHPADDDQPPQISLPLFDGFELQVDSVNCDDEYHELRYFLHRHSWEQPELLGYASGHFALPAFRWTEIDSLSRALHRVLADEVVASSALLLLFPSVWITPSDDPAYLSQRLAQAWSALDFLQIRDLDSLIRFSIAHPAEDLAWWNDPRLGWINNGMYSFRNPETLMCKFSERRFQRVSEFIASVEQQLEG